MDRTKSWCFPLKYRVFLVESSCLMTKTKHFACKSPTAPRWPWHPGLAVMWQRSRSPNAWHLGVAGEWLQLLLPKFAMGSCWIFQSQLLIFQMSCSFLSWGCSQCVVVLTLRPPKTLGSLSHFFLETFSEKWVNPFIALRLQTSPFGWGEGSVPCTQHHSTQLQIWSTMNINEYNYNVILNHQKVWKGEVSSRGATPKACQTHSWASGTHLWLLRIWRTHLSGRPWKVMQLLRHQFLNVDECGRIWLWMVMSCTGKSCVAGKGLSNVVWESAHKNLQRGVIRVAEQRGSDSDHQ